MLISGRAFGAGQVMAWKESGGEAGTFSPNAAEVQTVASLAAGVTYTVRLQWKANHATPGSIFVGAGLAPPMPKTLLVTYPTAFSPTRLTAELIPATNVDLRSAVSTKQYILAGSDECTSDDTDGSAQAEGHGCKHPGNHELHANSIGLRPAERERRFVDAEHRDQPGPRDLREWRRLWGRADRRLEGERWQRRYLLSQCRLCAGRCAAGGRDPLHHQAPVEGQPRQHRDDPGRRRPGATVLTNPTNC